MRLRARADAPQAQMISDLKRLGFSVQDLHNVGGGCPDLLVAGYVGYHDKENLGGLNLLVEIKTKTGRLTPDQVVFFDEWKGPKIVAYDVDDVLRWFGRS